MESEAETRKGRCFCGAVTFEYNGPENWCGHCHCDSCRRTTSAPFSTFIGVPKDAYRYTGKAPKVFASSAGVQRTFCDNCGSSIAYESDQFPGEIHFYVACMEKPDAYQPQYHVHCAEQLCWIALADKLPRHHRSSEQ